MKRTIYFTLQAAALLFASCSKEAVSSSVIILELVSDNISFDVESKATEISSIPASLHLERTTGTWKSETAKDASASKSVSTGKINTGWYQTDTPTAYNYYVSNNSITFAAGGSTISASNGTDVIAGCTQGATDSTTPSVTLDHVFARTGTLTCNTQSGYTISNISWKIKSKSGGTGGTAGTYNIATKGWNGVTALSEQALTSSTDLYCTPGAYTVSVTYTLTKGEYTKSFTKSGDVTLVAGKINNIVCTAIGGNASGIVLSVSLTQWSSETLNLGLS